MGYSLSGVFLVLVAINYCDLMRRQIPNVLLGGLLICLLLAFPQYWSSLGLSLAAGGAIWFFCIWGAGDAKLAAVLSIAIPTSSLLNAWLVTLYAGGVLAVVYLIKSRVRHCKPDGLPYGVAISIGFFSQILLSSVDIA
ncbi:A24 family peptidase [Aliagarivorans taiwanensis]|uniref:A24 family peptidase n=1 Tax=Aliagarivorans taiwanensis TaxID=561966 RepID=UPI000557E25A|nr:prepilin peptidase [Aliagarivorans taiwanensis]